MNNNCFATEQEAYDYIKSRISTLFAKIDYPDLNDKWNYFSYGRPVNSFCEVTQYIFYDVTKNRFYMGFEERGVRDKEIPTDSIDDLLFRMFESFIMVLAVSAAKLYIRKGESRRHAHARLKVIFLNSIQSGWGDRFWKEEIESLRLRNWPFSQDEVGEVPEEQDNIIPLIPPYSQIEMITSLK